MGRPRKHSADTEARLVERMVGGEHPEDLSRETGIPSATLRRWFEEGAEAAKRRLLGAMRAASDARQREHERQPPRTDLGTELGELIEGIMHASRRIRAEIVKAEEAGAQPTDVIRGWRLYGDLLVNAVRPLIQAGVRKVEPVADGNEHDRVLALLGIEGE